MVGGSTNSNPTVNSSSAPTTDVKANIKVNPVILANLDKLVGAIHIKGAPSPYYLLI